MLTPFVLAADHAGILDLAETSEVRARVTVPGDPTFGFDFYTQGQLQARGTDRRWEYTLSYLPSLTLPALEQGVDAQVFQNAGASVAWHTRALRIGVSEDAAYGTFNSAYLLPSTSGQSPTGGVVSPALQLAARPTTITMILTRTTGTVSGRVGRRATLSVDGAYTISGGLGADSQDVLPQERGPSGDVVLSLAPSRRDQVLTIAHGQISDFLPHQCVVPTSPTSSLTVPCEPQDRLVQIDEGIVHAIEPSTSLAMSAGVSVAWTRLHHEDAYLVGPFPDAGLSLTHRLGERGVSMLQFSAQLAPSVDQLTGVITERLQGQAMAINRMNKMVTLRGSASALYAFSTPNSFGATIISGDFEAGFQVSRRLRLAVGERGAWQTQDVLGTFFSSYTYFDVTVSAPTLRY